MHIVNIIAKHCYDFVLQFLQNGGAVLSFLSPRKGLIPLELTDFNLLYSHSTTFQIGRRLQQDTNCTNNCVSENGNGVVACECRPLDEEGIGKGDIIV